MMGENISEATQLISAVTCLLASAGPRSSSRRRGAQSSAQMFFAECAYT